LTRIVPLALPSAHAGDQPREVVRSTEACSWSCLAVVRPARAAAIANAISKIAKTVRLLIPNSGRSFDRSRRTQFWPLDLQNKNMPPCWPVWTGKGWRSRLPYGEVQKITPPGSKCAVPAAPVSAPVTKIPVRNKQQSPCQYSGVASHPSPKIYPVPAQLSPGRARDQSPCAGECARRVLARFFTPAPVLKFDVSY
jgi:hypothetical protein